MVIKEQCQGWTLAYDSPLLDPQSEDELYSLSAILHLAGDIVVAYNNIPGDLDPTVKSQILTAFSAIFTEAKDQVLECVNDAMANHVLNTPLDPDYSDANIFGFDLTESLVAALEPDEIATAAEHYLALNPSEDEPEIHD